MFRGKYILMNKKMAFKKSKLVKIKKKKIDV